MKLCRPYPVAYSLLAAMVALAGLSRPAAVADDGASPDESSEPAQSFQILHEKRIPLGDRSIIIRRVAKPDLPVIAPSGPATPQSAVIPPELLARAGKKRIALTIDATVYDDRITGLRWTYNGKSFEAFSNIHFKFLTDTRALRELETPHAVYSFFFMIGHAASVVSEEVHQRRAEAGLPPAANAWLPDDSLFPAAGASGYVVIAEPAADDPGLADACVGLDLLHAYFDENRARLISEYQEREHLQAERERQLRENPPPPKDTVIHYWRK